MKLNAKGRYAVTAMLDVALHGEDGPVALASIAERQDISRSYLEQLFSRLRRAGLVDSVRGPGGGYRLARGVPEISIAEVISAVDENVDATRCGGRENCQDNQPCLTHGLWDELGREIERYLGRVSLADVLRQRRVREVARRQNMKFAAHHGFGARLAMDGQEAAL